MPDSEKIYAVSELNQIARGLLETRLDNVHICGEISNLARPASGHLYFSLKDDSAQIRCALFKNRNMRLAFRPENGQQVVVRGKVSLYVPRGDYQLIIDTMQPAGEGLLQQAFDTLKQKLYAEGLFDDRYKQPLPAFPRALGVITSPSGAAIRDVLSVLQRRFPLLPVKIYPVPVQGDGAAEKIVNAIDQAGSDARCDVLLLTRGGGSLEDLWSFNEEIVARAIHDCPIPLVCGVGHEIDFTIADFAADVRAPTPSVAAELISPDGEELYNRFHQFGQYFIDLQFRQIRDHQQRVDWMAQRLQQKHPQQVLLQQQELLENLKHRLMIAGRSLLYAQHGRLNSLNNRLHKQSPADYIQQLKTRFSYTRQQLPKALDNLIRDRKNQLQQSIRALETISPLATLDRGYAIITDAKDRIIHDAMSLSSGDEVQARLSVGSFTSTVKAIEKK